VQEVHARKEELSSRRSAMENRTDTWEDSVRPSLWVVLECKENKSERGMRTIMRLAVNRWEWIENWCSGRGRSMQTKPVKGENRPTIWVGKNSRHCSAYTLANPDFNYSSFPHKPKKKTRKFWSLILSYTLLIFFERFDNMISSLYQVVVLGVSLRCTQSNSANSYLKWRSCHLGCGKESTGKMQDFIVALSAVP